MNNEQVQKIGLKIIQQFGKYGAAMKAGRPDLTFKLAKARFEGMLETASVALGAMTPFAIELVLIDLEREHGKMPPNSLAYNKEYKAWENAMLRGFVEAHARKWERGH